MRNLLVLPFLATALVLSAARAGESGTVFFNGKDLAGWEGLEQHWKVKDGMLVGKHDGLKFNTFLCSKRKYRDFELTFQVLLTGADANSGVQIRSRIFNPTTFAVAGPQCDMGGPYWGCLYGEHYSQDKGFKGDGMMKAADAQVVKRVLKTSEFTEYQIRCVGKHVTIKLNGETTVDGDFTMPEEGIIAWQLHAGGPMEVVFRHIQFKDLAEKR